MKRILSFELIKILNSLTLIYWIIFAVIFTITCIHEPQLLKMLLGSSFRYDEEIILNTIFVTSYYKYALVIFVVFITTREFGNNTINRAIYEGFSRRDLFIGKIALLFILILFVFILTRSILAIVFFLKGYSVHSIIFTLLNYHFIITELFSCFFLGMLGLMISLLTKNPYWAIGLFIVLAFLEYMATLFLYLTSHQELINYMPIGGMISFHRFLRFGDLGLSYLTYTYFLQIIFMVVIHDRYKNITWLRKR